MEDNLEGILKEMLDECLEEKMQNLLESFDLPTKIPKINKEDVMTILMGDKKVRDGKMRFILPKEIGDVDIYDDVDNSLFLKFFS